MVWSRFMDDIPLCDHGFGEIETEPSGMPSRSKPSVGFRYERASVRRVAGERFELSGLHLVEGRSPHSTRSIAKAIEDCVELISNKLQWAPKNLLISINARLTRSMGRAYPQVGSVKGTYIELNPRLLLEYDMQSIRRTLLHEMVHHVRFSQQNPPRTGDGAHDSEFCRMLAMVDPASASGGKKTCQFFTDDVDSTALSKRLGPASSVRFHVVDSRGRYKIKITSDRDTGAVPWSQLKLGTIETLAKMYGGSLSKIRIVSDGSVPSRNVLEFIEDVARRNPKWPGTPKVLAIIDSERRFGSRQDRASKPTPSPKKAAPKKPAPKKAAPKRAAVAKKSSQRPAPKRSKPSRGRKRR